MYYCKYCNSSFTTHNHKVMHEEDCPYKGAELGYKFCKKCGKEKLLSEFNICKARYDELNGHCRDCTQTYYKNWSAEIMCIRPIRNF